MSIGLEVAGMSEEQFGSEKLYQATMSMAKNLLIKGIVSTDEYKQIDTIFREKYKPSLGILFSDIDLLFLERQGNI